jgi:hypothetical protein
VDRRRSAGCRRTRWALRVPRSSLTTAGPPHAGTREVWLAGLRTRGHEDVQPDRPRFSPTVRRFPGDRLASPRPVLMTAFVPTYRCGAVPDSHRIPSWRPTWMTGRPATGPPYLANYTLVEHQMWCFAASICGPVGARVVDNLPRLWTPAGAVCGRPRPARVDGSGEIRCGSGAFIGQRAAGRLGS